MKIIIDYNEGCVGNKHSNGIGSSGVGEGVCCFKLSGQERPLPKR